MTLRVKDLNESNLFTVESNEINGRLKLCAPKAGWYRYVVYNRNSEVGFLAIDTYPNKRFATIYEIYVVESERGNGFGNWILMEAERIILAQKIFNIQLNSKTLAKEVNQDRLDEWYIRKGYFKDGEKMTKTLNAQTE